MFDPNTQDFVKHRAKEVVNSPKLGRVVSVYEHVTREIKDEEGEIIQEADNSNFECDVIVDGTFEERAVPYNGSHSGHISPPKVGDKVLVIYRAGENSKPILIGTGYTNEDRAPLGRAGMYRDVYESGTSPTGDGDFNTTRYTYYDDTPARIDKSELSPKETWLQFAKEEPTANPADWETVPMMLELYDSPTTEQDESWIKMRGNQVDGDDSLMMDTTLDFKEGTTTVQTYNDTEVETLELSLDVKNGSLTLGGFGSGGKNVEIEVDLRNNTAKLSGDGSNEMGISLDFGTDEFTLIDGSGYGIESDGSGNFTWHYESLNYSQGTTTSL